MTHSRREFLRGAGAVALLGATGGWGLPARTEDHKGITLHARLGTVRLAPPDYPETPIWGYALAAFPVRGTSRKARLPAPAPLPPNPVPALGDLAKARHETLRMDGGAMGRMRQAMLGGRMVGARDLAELGKVWAFNGLAEIPDEPLFTAGLGETVRLTMVNATAWPHAIHLHGHHFRAIASDGTTAPLRDTLLMDREETVEIAFVADNWLLHCHMPEHSVAGMKTWFRVA